MALFEREPRATRNLPRRDYVALNNGLNGPMPTTLQEATTYPTAEMADHEGSEGPLPSESVSQVSGSYSSIPTSSAENISRSTTSSIVEPLAKRRRVHTSWAQEHFWITELDTQWSKKGQLAQNDRLLVCKRCSWSSSDSSRYGTTSNLLTHLRTRHRLGSETASVHRQSVGPLDRLFCSVQGNLSLEQALVRWIVQTRQPFTTVEHPSFKAIFDAAAVTVPLRRADTLRDRVKQEFRQSRDDLKRDLAQHCESLAISLDTWTSEHQLSILAIIGHWVTPTFERREALLDFVELPGPHSGENMAAVVLAMLHELEIAPKLLTITGDNAGNNGTMCDALYAELSKTYDDEDSEFRLRPLMRFHGRTSFIRCLAHIINLICKDILAHFGAGSMKEAKVALDQASATRSLSLLETGTSVLVEKNVIVKIRLLVLWIARSPQRLQEWRRVSPRKLISYDVETRWNSTFIMITDALRLRKELTQFVRIHAEVEALLPTEEDWLLLRQLETVLKPFWEYTNVMSQRMPTVADSLPIYWSLNDLLHDVCCAQGDFSVVNATVQAAVRPALEKVEKFTRKMDENILYYVATVLDPRIKTSLIRAHMGAADATLIVAQVRGFLQREYPFIASQQPEPTQPPGMPDSLWKMLRRVQPGTDIQTSDVDRYLDSAPVNWSSVLS